MCDKPVSIIILKAYMEYKDLKKTNPKYITMHQNLITKLMVQECSKDGYGHVTWDYKTRKDMIYGMIINIHHKIKENEFIISESDITDINYTISVTEDAIKYKGRII